MTTKDQLKYQATAEKLRGQLAKAQAEVDILLAKLSRVEARLSGEPPQETGLGRVGVLQALAGPLGARMYAVSDSGSQQLRSFRAEPVTRKDPEEMWDYLQSVIVFAARYTHNRATGGAGLVIELINQEWHRMSERTRKQLLQESYEADENIGEWKAFRETHTAG